MSRERATGLPGGKNGHFYGHLRWGAVGVLAISGLLWLATLPYYGVWSEPPFAGPSLDGPLFSEAAPSFLGEPCPECGRTGHLRFYPPDSRAFTLLLTASATPYPTYAAWVGGDQMRFLRLIAKRETTRGNPRLVNRIGCKGLWQQHPVHGVASDCPVRQTEWAFGYIRRRYGSPERAWAHHRRRNWY